MQHQTSFKCDKLKEGGDADVSEKYVMSLDFGTSNIRCHLYDKQAKLVGKSSQPLDILYLDGRGVEMDPDSIWEQVLIVMKEAMADAKIMAERIASLGISTQRATFILWDKQTGKPIHKFVVWQDTRGEHIEKAWNESYTMKMVRNGGKFAHGVTHQKRFLAAAVLKFRTNHVSRILSDEDLINAGVCVVQVSIRLLWILEKYPELRKLAREGKVRLGTLDTWLIWKLTGGRTYATEMSCASCSGLYDPYTQQWSGFFMKLLDIPIEMFPPVLDTDADFGVCCSELFGAEIPIRAAFGDQQSAMFGQCCLQVGHVKLTMGTGTFMNINVGSKPHTSVEGFYPVIGWKRGSEIVHLGEGSCNTAGDAVDWLISTFSITSPEMTESVAESVPDSNGVYFVPAFNGLQAPDNDFSACGSLIGLKSSTSKAHITRAVLEALAFKNAQLFSAMTSELSFTVKKVVCDGGVTANNFVMQLTSDLTGKEIHRMQNSDMSALGAAFMAGRAVGFWKSDAELQEFITIGKTFYPDKDRAKRYAPVMKQWKRALSRSMKWYD